MYAQNGTEIPEGATRITFEFWTTAPYSEAERDSLNSDLAGFVKEGDDDILDGVFNLTFETEKEIAAAKEKDLREFLNDAETIVTLKFGPERNDLEIVLGEDD